MIAAVEFVQNKFVVVYLTGTGKKPKLQTAVMSRNANNDLGNLKIYELSKYGDLVGEELFKITSSQIAAVTGEGVIVYDFALFDD